MPTQASAATAAAAPARASRRDEQRPALSHFVIFNPSLAVKQKTKDAQDGSNTRNDTKSPEASTPADQVPTETAASPHVERDRDLEDDLREASQIVFYTSREAGGVSRDRMLRQVGLAKGLMGFADMMTIDKDSDSGLAFWAIHAQTQRLIVYSPEPDWFIYICISLPREVKHDPKDKDAPKPPEPVQFTDRMLVDGLQRGYEDFCLLHASLAAQLPPTPALSALLERYWTRFAMSYETAYITPGPASPLLTWLGGWPPAGKGLKDVRRALKDVVDESGGCAGLVTTTGPLAAAGDFPDDTEALTRFLVNTLVARQPPPAPVPDLKHDRHNLGFGFGRRKREPLQTHEPRKSSWSIPFPWVGMSAPASRSATPVQPPTPTPTVGAKAEGSPIEGKTRWPSLGLGGIGDAMGNMGAALGLSASSAPSPKPSEADAQDEDKTGGKVRPDQQTGSRDEAAGDGDKGTGDAEKEDGSVVEDDAEKVVGRKHSAANSGQVSPVGSQGSSQGRPSSPGSSVLPEDTITAEVATLPGISADEVPELALTTPSRTLVDADTISIAPSVSGVSQTDVAMPDLTAAVEDLILSWESRQVWLSGEQRKLHWVIRDKALLFVLSEDTPPSGQEVFAAYSAYASKPPKPKPHPNTIVNHTTHITEVNGPLDSRNSATLAAMKQNLASVDEIYVQTGTGQLLVAKETEEGELFVVTAKDASLTDAERVVRQCSQPVA